MMKRVGIVHPLRVAMMCLLVVPTTSSIAFASAYEEAFASRLNNPADTNSLNHFINIAVESGQYDQALSTLEQHLIAHPRDAQARLIAGRLYNHVGSFELAQRQVKHAISIGTLDADETAEANRLLQKIEKDQSGNYGDLSVTVGAEVVRTEFSSAAAISDRTDLNPYGDVTGYYRFGLDSPTDDAIVFAVNARLTRQFGDFDLSGNGGSFTFPSARASATWEMGLPNSGITSLRLGLSAYGIHSSFQKDEITREYGMLAKFTAQPSADSNIYANFGVADLSTSDLLFTDIRYRTEIGGAHRITSKQAIGASLRGQFDYTYGGTDVGRSLEATASYSGVLWSPPKGPAWTHRLSAGGGTLQLPDLNLSPGDKFDGNFWTARWDHVFELNDRSKINLDTYFRRYSFDDSSRDQTVFGIGLSYTYTFN